MIIFSKDIQMRGHHHKSEGTDAGLAAYMEYQRKLFPYTIIRGGLDFAYKELDDILDYIENGNQKPENSERDEYPEDIPGWFKFRFPWAGSFMALEEMHSLMVRLIQAMDSFRTYEVPTTWHWAVLYDTTHNIIQFYNEMIETNYNVARDIHLSNNVAVDFDDFINNYWPHLEFMLLSKPDFPHARLLERNFKIEEWIKGEMADGLPPLEVLESAASKFQFHPGTLELLRRDPITPEMAELESRSLEEDFFQHLENTLDSGLSQLDADYLESFRHSKNQPA